MKRLVVFDLDGTIIDSISDIQNSMNTILNNHNLVTFSKEEYISFIGNGSKVLTQRALEKNDITDEKTIDVIHQEYLDYYFNHSTDLTKEFDFVTDTLLYLKKSGIKLAVLSNKPHKDCIKIVDKLFPNVFDLVIGMKSDFTPKPDFMSMNFILNTFNIKKKDLLFVGDSIVDVKLAINNQIDFVFCSYGYSTAASVNEELLKANNSKVNILFRFDELKKIVFENEPFKTQFISKKLSFKEIDEIYSHLKNDYQYDGFEYFYYEDDQDYMKKVKDLCDKYQPKYLIMHLPFEKNRLNLSSSKEEEHNCSINLLKRAIDYGIKNNTHRFVFHSGFKDDNNFDDLVFYVLILKAIHNLLEYTAQSKVLLMMENLVANEEITNKPFVLKMFLDLTKNYRFKITFDVGHANVANVNIPKFIKTFKNDIAHFHLNNNFKKSDDHFGLKKGVINYKKIVKTLKKINYKNSISIETGWELNEILENNQFLKELDYFK